MQNDLQAHGLLTTLSVTPVAGWARPLDWLAMPTVSETEEKFVGLFVVYDAPLNPIALYFEGDYTVDWGDGTVEDFSSGDTAQHSYDWNDISSSTLTTEGYRQVLVTVTPQAGQQLSIMDLTAKHDSISPYTYSTPWLDLKVSMPNAASGGSLRFSYQYGMNGNVYLYSVQRVHIVHAGGMTDFSECFYNYASLRSVIIDNSPNADNFNYLFDSCNSLTDVVLSDTASVTDMSWMFYYCRALTTVPLFDTNLVDNTSGMFSGCSSLTTVPEFNTALVTDMSNMFYICSALTTVPEFNTALVTDMSNMFSGCSALQTAALNGTQVDVDYSNCLLSASALNDIFNNLATVVTTKTINISGNYGAATCDTTIATNKGWTVIA